MIRIGVCRLVLGPDVLFTVGAGKFVMCMQRVAPVPALASSMVHFGQTLVLERLWSPSGICEHHPACHMFTSEPMQHQCT